MSQIVSVTNAELRKREKERRQKQCSIAYPCQIVPRYLDIVIVDLKRIAQAEREREKVL